MSTPTPPTPSLRRATLVQIGGRLYGSATTFLTLALLARALERPEFGRFTFYLAAFALLDSISDLGLRTLLVQRTAAEPGRLAGLLPTARRARLLLAALGGLAVAGLAFALDEPGAVWIAVACLYPLTHAFELSTVAWTNRLAWGWPVACRTGGVTVRLALVLGALALGERRPAVFLLCIAAGSALANVALHVAARKELRGLPRALQERLALLPMIWAALPLGLAALCQQLYFYIDNLFVRVYSGDDELGLYNACARLMSFAIMVPIYAALAALPKLRREFAAGRLWPATLRLCAPLAAFGLVFGALGALLAEPILRLLFGAEFAAGADTLRWLFGAVAAVHVGAVLTTALVAAGANRAMLWIAALALLLNLTGNALVVPTYGIEGAASTTLLTELFVAAGALVWLRRAAYSADQKVTAEGSNSGPQVR